jgi:hypothetical protein
MSKYLIILLALLAGALVFSGCSDDCDDTTTPPTTIPDLAFAGSDKCMSCHQENYDKWVKSGHPYKLTKIQGESPDLLFPEESMFPNDSVVPPTGYTWADISYTIGGYGWKMRWIDENGYIITGIPNNQYNFETQTWSDYHLENATGTKPYDCGKCHTTGWVDSGGIGDPENQDGLAGMTGTFFAGGVHCEQCHGMGSRHVAAPADFAMTKDTSSALCGSCHTRDAENRIAASSGFIKHHEQFDEWSHSPHNSAIGCNTCHDPHASVKFDSVMPGDGTTKSCTDCHSIAGGDDQDYDGANLNHNGAPGCVNCHMPKASKSAINLTDYVGDIRTHIFNINTDAVGKTDGMFNADGSLVKMDEAGQAAVTLDFACYSCHEDENGGGGTMARPLTLQELSDRAIVMHSGFKTLARR